MTNQQGAPEALFYADALDRCAEVDFDHIFVPAAAVIRRLHAENERLAALVEAQQPAAHVQNHAEIEHVAGDVSKNRPESNMAQQPAPSAAAIRALDAYNIDTRDADPGSPLERLRFFCSLAMNGQDWLDAEPFFNELAAQPSPTPQADSQPAAVLDERDDFEKVFPLPSGCIRVGTGYASTGYSNWAAHTHVERWQGWQARAARAPADRVLEDAALSSEQQRAIFEAYESAASESYFEVRPQIDCNDRRRVFKAGYERGWDAARKQGGA